jgi:hypothetical protein
VSRRQHPTLAQAIAIATESTRSGQHVTNRSPTYHFATSLVQNPLIDSLKQKTSISTIHATPTPPDRRRCAAQHAQSALRVPVHQPIL